MFSLRAAAGSLFLSLLTLAVAPGAWAQGGGAPPLPLGIDLKKVPVGSWSDYSLLAGTKGALQQRISLVGKTATGYEMEVAVQGGPVPSSIVTRVELGLQPTAGKRVKRAVMRAGARLPMEIPGSSDLVSDQFPSIDPKAYLSTQDVEVPAGRFKAKVYRTVAARGAIVDYWVSEEVRPMGIVKMEINFKRAGMSRLTLKLVAQGKGAKGTELKPVRVFDEQRLIAEMMADMKKAAAVARPAQPAHPAGAPPPLKSPH